MRYGSMERNDYKLGTGVYLMAIEENMHAGLI